ncbi:glyoxalase/bleomycin resistance/dioxygenase family protein [Nocardia uniformis]|uniref:Glyoxalase/bleomycin resistance/dioxygenase family protein n=1 Tax=Nocardia uniformis TaxID=53432 RepID=A0A849BRI3_9NOCA|nr:VOC family protein [Nocardia uniformis]NNH68714.1 glyoxalase/bleomycin resistance/dioxygenase family protein [Nocardia uniformis]
MRRYAFFIDCSADGDFDEGVRFWSAALESDTEAPDDPTDPYVSLPAARGTAQLEMQRIGGPSRYHLDLYAADVNAEADRLEALGAERIEFVDRWWVMRAPTGHIFCVVPD